MEITIAGGFLFAMVGLAKGLTMPELLLRVDVILRASWIYCRFAAHHFRADFAESLRRAKDSLV